MTIFLNLALLTALIALSLYLPARMAMVRQRNPQRWMLISLLATPLIAVPVLMVLGHTTARQTSA